MLYSVLEFVHVVAVTIWVGGLFAVIMFNRAFAKTGDRTLMQGFGKQAGAFSMQLFMPAMLVSLITGIAMVQVADVDFGATWVIWGLAGLVVSAVLGAYFTGAAARKMLQRIQRGEIDPAGIAAARKRIMIASVLNVLVLFSIVWAMVAKPD